MTRPPLPPFTAETAARKVRAAENTWNTREDEHGYMRVRIASINDLPIKETERKYFWPLGPRPDDHPGLTELGL